MDDKDDKDVVARARAFSARLAGLVGTPAKAAGLDVVTIQWSGPLPDGQNRAAIGAALAAMD